MRCPSCHRPVDHEADSCYSCGYSSREAMKKFGANQVKMKRIHDAADCLRVQEGREIAATFDELETRFPQLLFTVYLGELNDAISIGELGFWLLNQSKIESAEFARTNDSCILLIVDVVRKQAGISLGYLTEMLLSEEDCLRALMASRSFFINGDFGGGVITLFRKIEKILVQQAREMKGLSRREKQSRMMHNHHGMNSLPLPVPAIPAQFDPNAVLDDEQPRQFLMFKNEFESERT